jgi:hypothetical protein
MNYFLLTYTDDLPEKFGGIAWGPLIKIRPKYEGDKGLLEHEKTHVRQWYALTGLGLVIAAALMLLVSPAFWPISVAAPFLHALIYKYLRPYRQWCEVRAYREQIAVGYYVHLDFAMTALVDKYDLGLDADEARALLIN